MTRWIIISKLMCAVMQMTCISIIEHEQSKIVHGNYGQEELLPFIQLL